MRLTIIGPPASGKSTLTEALTHAHPTVTTFGVRRYFAEQVARGTGLGRAAAETVRDGGWLPDELVVAAVRQELTTGGLGRDFILEGMPGNRRQAELLDKQLDEFNCPLDAAVYLSAEPQVCAARARRRIVCLACDGGSHPAVVDADERCVTCGSATVARPSDAPKPFAERLRQHHSFLPELVEYYRPDRLIGIDTDGLRPEEVHKQCIRLLRTRQGVPL
ncbi:adenylate kinase family protein [Nocardia nova]